MNYLQFLAANRRFLGFGFAMAFFSSFGQTFFIAIFGDEIRGTFDLSHGDFGLVYSLATLASGLSIIWLGRKLDTVDLRLFSTVLCAGLVTACFAMGIAPGVAVLVLGIYLLRLTGQGLLSHTAMTSMARYFDEARGTVERAKLARPCLAVAPRASKLDRATRSAAAMLRYSSAGESFSRGAAVPGAKPPAALPGASRLVSWAGRRSSDDCP